MEVEPLRCSQPSFLNWQLLTHSSENGRAHSSENGRVHSSDSGSHSNIQFPGAVDAVLHVMATSHWQDRGCGPEAAWPSSFLAFVQPASQGSWYSWTTGQLFSPFLFCLAELVSEVKNFGSYKERRRTALFQTLCPTLPPGHKESMKTGPASLLLPFLSLPLSFFPILLSPGLRYDSRGPARLPASETFTTHSTPHGLNLLHKPSLRRAFTPHNSTPTNRWVLLVWPAHHFVPMLEPPA